VAEKEREVGVYLKRHVTSTLRMDHGKRDYKGSWELGEIKRETKLMLYLRLVNAPDA